MYKVGFVLTAIVVFVGAFVCLTRGAHSDAGTNSASDNLKQVCENIVNHACHADEKGFHLLFENILGPPSDEERELLAQQILEDFLTYRRGFGEFLGPELIEEKSITNTIRKYIYLAKYERNVVFCTFILYSPHNEWKILSFNWKFGSDAVNSIQPLTPNP
jgi:hypothetical protein